MESICRLFLAVQHERGPRKPKIPQLHQAHHPHHHHPHPHPHPHPHQHHHPHPTHHHGHGLVPHPGSSAAAAAAAAAAAFHSHAAHLPVSLVTNVSASFNYTSHISAHHPAAAAAAAAAAFHHHHHPVAPAHPTAFHHPHHGGVSLHHGARSSTANGGGGGGGLTPTPLTTTNLHFPAHLLHHNLINEAAVAAAAAAAAAASSTTTTAIMEIGTEGGSQKSLDSFTKGGVNNVYSSPSPTATIQSISSSIAAGQSPLSSGESESSRVNVDTESLSRTPTPPSTSAVTCPGGEENNLPHPLTPSSSPALILQLHGNNTNDSNNNNNNNNNNNRNFLMNKMETSTLSPESIIRVPTGSSASPSPTSPSMAVGVVNIVGGGGGGVDIAISPLKDNVFFNGQHFEMDYNGMDDNGLPQTSPRAPPQPISPSHPVPCPGLEPGSDPGGGLMSASTSSAAIAASFLSTARVARAAARAKVFYNSSTRPPPGNGGGLPALLDFRPQHSNCENNGKQQEIVQYHQMQSQQNSILFPPLPQQIIGLDSRLISWEMLQETTARLLFMAVRWVKCLTPFQSLTRHDQLLLLQESWRELFLLNLAQWITPLDIGCIFDSVMIRDRLSSDETTELEMKTVQELLLRFRQTTPDGSEVGCLKAIALFTTEVGGLTELPTSIEMLHEQAQCILSDHVRMRYPRQQAATRFSRLLLLLPLLRSIRTATIESLFFKETIGNVPIARLLKDIYTMEPPPSTMTTTMTATATASLQPTPT